MAKNTSDCPIAKQYFFLRSVDHRWVICYDDTEILPDFLVCVFRQNEKLHDKFCYAKDIWFNAYIDRIEPYIPLEIREILEQKVLANLHIADRAFYKKSSDGWERCSDEDGQLIVCTVPPRTPVYNQFCGAWDLTTDEEITDIDDLPPQVLTDLNLSKERQNREELEELHRRNQREEYRRLCNLPEEELT